jgi:hypothetical protein
LSRCDCLLAHSSRAALLSFVNIPFSSMLDNPNRPSKHRSCRNAATIPTGQLDERLKSTGLRGHQKGVGTDAAQCLLRTYRAGRQSPANRIT